MLSLDHSKNIVEVKEVSFSYEHTLILDQVSLKVHPGDYLGIIGPNGAGKTTLLKIMLGLLTPDKGMVELFGIDIRNFKDYSKIAYVPQKVIDFDINFPATVQEIVSMGRYAQKGLFHRLKATDFEIVNKSLEQVKMQKYRDVLIGDLSGGQAQRVFLARALVSQPELIFLDEPTTGVDPKSQDDFYKLLRELNHKMGLSLVLVSHDTERLVNEVMHIACLDHNLVCHNSPEDFIHDSDYLNIHGQKIRVIPHHHNN